MAIEYTRRLTNLVVQDLTIDGQVLTDCVVRVSWEYEGTDDEGYVGIFEGTMSFREDRHISVDNYIDYNTLTEEQIWSWIDARTTDVYAQHQKDIVQKQINRQKTVTEVDAENFPWVNT